MNDGAALPLPRSCPDDRHAGARTDRLRLRFRSGRSAGRDAARRSRAARADRGHLGARRPLGGNRRTEAAFPLARGARLCRQCGGSRGGRRLAAAARLRSLHARPRRICGPSRSAVELEVARAVVGQMQALDLAEAMADRSRCAARARRHRSRQPDQPPPPRNDRGIWRPSRSRDAGDGWLAALQPARRGGHRSGPADRSAALSRTCR